MMATSYCMCTVCYACIVADDGLELEKLPKVKVLRNDKREGSVITFL